MKAKIEDGYIIYKSSNSIEIKIHIGELFESMSDDDREVMAEHITWDKIMDEAIKKLSGKANEWSGDDKMKAISFLADMEKYVLTSYKWSYLKQLEQLSKEILCHKELYWKMYHDEDHKDFFRKWMEDEGIKSSYDAVFLDHEKFMEYVDTAFKEAFSVFKEKSSSPERSFDCEI